MLGPYRLVLATPGAKRWTSAGFVARMPISMVSLAVVLLVSAATGSYALAGTVTAVYSLAAAASAPLMGRAVDAWGQSAVLVPGCALFGAALGGLVLAVEAGWPTPVPHVFAGLAGICYPPVGACVRARWAQALGASDALHTAYSFEAVVDEAIYMAGPILVTLLATEVAFWLGVVSVIGFAVVGGCWLGSQRVTQPPGTGWASRSSSAGPLGWRSLGVLVAAALCLGALFGSTEVATVAFAAEHGHRGYAGALLAAWALGSLIAGLVTGSLSAGVPALLRFRLGAAGMACAMLPLPFVPSIWLLGVVLFAGGLAVSPTLVACVSLVHSRVPAERLTEGITWVTTGLGLGVAPGAAIAGAVIDAHGASAAFAVPAVGGALAVVLAGLTPEHRPGPPDPPDPVGAAPWIAGGRGEDCGPKREV